MEFGEIEEAFGEGFTRQVFEGTVGRKKSIEPTSWAGRVIARQHPDEAVRRRMHVGANATDESHVEVLEDLLMTRSRLAQLVGRESWGEVALEDKMAKTPRNVMGFLEKLNQENLPLARADLRVLQAAKKSDIGGYGSAKINAWDKDFYTDYSATSSPLPDISPFFSLGTCFSGLSKLFTSLYGIRFEVEDVAPGEIWVEGVRKLRVIDEDEGRIGTIYCDLFDREGKQSGAAHYTVRCSRRIDDDFADSDFTPDGMGMIDGVAIPRADMEGLETNGVRWRGREGVHQEPIIVLVCGFGNSGSESSKAKVGPTLLQWHEVETLFHEMGHAIHCTSFSLIRTILVLTIRLPSYDRTNGLPQRIGYSLRHRLRGATVDSHGASHRLAHRPLLIRSTPRKEHSTPSIPTRRTSQGSNEVLRPRDEQSNHDGGARPEIPFRLTASEIIHLVQDWEVRYGQGHEAGPRGVQRHSPCGWNRFPNFVRTFIRLRIDVLFLSLRPSDSRQDLPTQIRQGPD